MTLRARIAATLVFLGGIGGLLLFVLGSGPAERPVVQQWVSATQCRDCHQEIWNEWYGSQHQISFLNPEVRALSDDFRNMECRACHLPRPISVTGYGQRTLYRMTQPDEGVSCLTCHLGANGEILARHARPDVGCAPVDSIDLISVDLCASCHNQHQTTDQFRASSFAVGGKTCNECHMPEVKRAHGGRGRAHRYPATRDLDVLRSAGKLTVVRENGELVVSLQNHGAGHNFPTEERHRAVDIEVRFDDAAEWTRVWRARQPYRDEPGENTQLPAGETKTVRVPIPEGAERARVRLWYRRTPFVGDDDPRSMLLEEREVNLQ